MKTKIIPFDLETAKKIQAGEFEGKIKTREGCKARILCTDMKRDYPMAVVITFESGYEDLYAHKLNGACFGDNRVCDYDLVLEVPDDEPQFKPFERVLVRDNDASVWACSHFSHIQDGMFICENYSSWRQCIPYEGNENLVGTTDKPKED